MSENLLSLRLHGEVPLDLFAKAITNFNLLISALTKDVSGSEDISWQIHDLRAGSAYAAVRAYGDNSVAIDNIVESYETIGERLSVGKPLHFSDEITKPVFKIARLVNGHVSAITFGTSNSNFDIDEIKATSSEPVSRIYSIGTIVGIAGTITTRPHLKLTVFDNLFDRAVSCHVQNTFREELRGAWDKEVSISGMIYRDPDTGRPIEIKDIRDIQIIPEKSEWDFRQARGVLFDFNNNETVVESVRRLRNAETG